MANLWLLAICFLAGVLARRSGKLPESTPVVLNSWVMWLALPALIIHTIHKIPFRPELLLAAGSLWMVFLVAAALALLLSPNVVSRRTAGGLALACGLGNTAFMGLPMMEAFAGKEGMQLALVVDQLGSFLVLSLVAVPFAAHMSGRHASFRLLVLRVLRFAPFLALIFALLSRPFAYPDVAESVLQRLADTLSPIALASVGWQLRLGALRSRARPVAVGLLYKLAAAPLMVFLLLYFVAPHFGELERISITQAAMPPMVTASVLATEYDLDGELTALLVGLGVPISLLTVPLIWGAVQRL
ncbi:MAG: AEC family transporter [Myxococcaceae bacterium]